METAFLKLKTSFKEMAAHPYFLPLMLVLVGVAFYFWTKRNTNNFSQYAGGDETSSQTSNTSQPATSSSTPTLTSDSTPVSSTPTPTSEPSAQTTVVLFYTDWCGHCQNFKPTWHEMMNKYQGQPNVKLDEINCGENKEIAQQYQIEGYPTIIKFTDQSPPKVYEGNRSPADLDAFINSK